MTTPRRNTAPGISQSGKIKVGASGPYSEIKPAANQKEKGIMKRPVKGRYTKRRSVIVNFIKKPPFHKTDEA